MKTEFEIAPGITLHIGQRPSEFPSEEERTKWTNALRSGRYKQGKEALRKGDYYCCLGVKEELDGCKWSKGNNEGAPEPVYFTDSGSNAAYSRPSKWLTRFGDLPCRAYVRVRPDGACSTYTLLTELNDAGFTFTQIADIIDIVWNPKTYANNP